MGRSKRLYDFMMKFYKPSQWVERFSFSAGKDSEKNTSAHLIPVNRVIRAGKSVVLPGPVLRSLVERAQVAGIMSECLCRKGEGCRAYPHSTGCLILGGAALDLHPGLGRVVTREEALAHAERAVAMGLFPMVVHNEFDAWLWGIDYRRMLNVCFCCDCCCSVRRGVRLRRSEGFFQNIHRLPGLTVTVSGPCTSCGICRDLCLAGAVEMTAKGARIIPENCKGCGRCAAACPEKAIRIELDGRVDPAREIVRIYTGRTEGILR